MKCQYPNCSNEGSHAWAMVPLCMVHYDTIHIETIKFYTNSDSRPEVLQRPKYAEIDFKIPWSKRSLAKMEVIGNDAI